MEQVICSRYKECKDTECDHHGVHEKGIAHRSFILCGSKVHFCGPKEFVDDDAKRNQKHEDLIQAYK